MSTRILLALVALPILLSQVAAAQVIPLTRPGDRDFVLDAGELLDPATEQAIKAKADLLLTDTAIPIVVVTISSMANYGFPDLRIETFATILFDQWGIGYKDLNGQSWKRGILFLVSSGDRKARIELGADWGRDFDRQCQQIMDGQIVPKFKSGDFAGGILAGVDALDKMSRGIPIPNLAADAARAQASGRHAAPGSAPGITGAIGGCLAGIGQMIMFPFMVIAALFSRMFGGGGRSGGGGGFSGGSFGGGHSGGGGATGSW